MAAYTNFYTPENAAFYARRPYQALDAAKGQCRFLRRETRSINDGPLSCELLDQVPLTGASGRYSAISYYSGDPRSTAEIIVGGIAFNAFRNLDSAIRNLVSNWTRVNAGAELLLWVDQICIDQSNAAEKAYQVGFMREIYHEAEQVYVHLNVPGDDTACLFDLCRAHVLTDANSAHAEASTPTALLPNQSRFQRDKRVWDSIAALFNHAWWGRAWVYQEFIVANRCVVYAWTKFLDILDPDGTTISIGVVH
jgi:hypothetical protein